MSSDQDQPQGTVRLESETPKPGDESVSLIDCAPHNGGRPMKFLALRSYAEHMIAADPVRFRIVGEDETAPLKRSDEA